MMGNEVRHPRRRRRHFRWLDDYDDFLIPGQLTGYWSVPPMEKASEASDPAVPSSGPHVGSSAGGSRGQDPKDAKGPPGGPSDGELVEQVQRGRREAFDALIRRYQRQAVAVSYRLLGNSHDALEVTQDAFLKEI